MLVVLDKQCLHVHRQYPKNHPASDFEKQIDNVLFFRRYLQITILEVIALQSSQGCNHPPFGNVGIDRSTKLYF